MRRRDTIIIAILVNAGLLLVLFATAMRSDDKKKEGSTKLAEATSPPKSGSARSASPLTTEELLNEYIAQASPQKEQEELIVLDDFSSSSGVTITPIAREGVISSLPAAVPTNTSTPLLTPHDSSQERSVAEVVVKKGDYLEKIAKTHHTTVSAIMKMNNMSSTQLKIGQVIRIPGKAQAGDKKESTPSLQGDVYVVQEGDSPWLIASKCHVKVEELLRINNLDDQKAKRLRPGDKLRIR
jgi:LysM repeat protein